MNRRVASDAALTFQIAFISLYPFAANDVPSLARWFPVSISTFQDEEVWIYQ